MVLCMCIFQKIVNKNNNVKYLNLLHANILLSIMSTGSSCSVGYLRSYFGSCSEFSLLSTSKSLSISNLLIFSILREEK